MPPASNKPVTPEPVTTVRLSTCSHTASSRESPPSPPHFSIEEAGSPFEFQNAPLSAEEAERRVRKRVLLLEALERNREREKTLMHQLGLDPKSLPVAKHPRTTDDHDSDYKFKVIKVKNVIEFNTRMTYRRRQEWLQDLDRAFTGDPRKFVSAANRILFALEHMEPSIRSRWYSHRDTQKTQGLAVENDWEHFEKWTSRLVSDIGDEDSTALKEKENARQRSTSPPGRSTPISRAWNRDFPAFPKRSEQISFTSSFTRTFKIISSSTNTTNASQPEKRWCNGLTESGPLPSSRENLSSHARASETMAIRKGTTINSALTDIEAVTHGRQEEDESQQTSPAIPAAEKDIPRLAARTTTLVDEVASEIEDRFVAKTLAVPERIPREKSRILVWPR